MSVYTKEYYEHYACKCISTLFPTVFTSLKHVGGNEAPDLQDADNGIGIEVTTAYGEDEFQASSLYGKYCNCDSSIVPKAATDKLDKLGKEFMTVDGKVYALWDKELKDTSEFNKERIQHIRESIERKVRKLNGEHFTQFSKQGLFVFCPDVNETTLKEILCNIVNVQDLDKRMFSKIYVLVIREILYAFDTESLEMREFLWKKDDYDCYKYAMIKSGMATESEFV